MTNVNNPLVSIIVRTKDRPKLLAKALQSISGQTYGPIEVVLVNDGGCELDIEELAGILGKVSLNYIRLDTNYGRAHAGNVGIENARGHYVGFLDDDDEFYPDHVSILVSFLADTDFRIAYTDSLMAYIEYDAQRGELTDVRKELVFSQDFDYDYLIFENYIPFMCLLFERTVLVDLGGFDRNFEVYEDWDLLIRLGEKFPFHHIKKTTANYNQWDTEQQISQSNKDYQFIEQSYLRILSKHWNKVSEKRVRSYISHLRTTIRDKETFIAAIKDKDTFIKLLEEQIREKDEMLDLIYASHGWKVLSVYYRIRDSLLPLDSRRRLVMRLSWIVLTNPGGFFRNLTKANVRKFFAQYQILDPSVLENKVRRKTSLSVFDSQPAKCAPLNTGEFLQSAERLNCMDGNKHILVVDRFVPTYDKDSGSFRMFSFLTVLNDMGYKIVFLPDDLNRMEPYTSELQRMGIEVLNGHIDVEKYLERTGHLFSFVILSRPEQTLKYLALVRAYAINSYVIYDTVDLHWVRFERASLVTCNDDFMKEAKRYKSMELFNALSSDVTFTITEDERRILLKEDAALKVEVVPNIHEVVGTNRPFDARRDVMFIGGFLHQPNEDAVFYFVKEIFPLIKKMVKDLRLFVVGSDPSESLKKLNSEDIIVTGYVRDVAPYFENCRVFVSPLRYGAGMKGKIGQSMAYGLPVVTTTIGAEGIGLIDGENALISDDPKEFAEATIRLYEDEKLWHKLSKKSMEHIDANYSRRAFAGRIERIFNEIKAGKIAFVKPQEKTEENIFELKR
jgi:glycosyltransferase involved in cell wall biosynthesis